jgi:hypothetical protein
MYEMIKCEHYICLIKDEKFSVGSIYIVTLNEKEEYMKLSRLYAVAKSHIFGQKKPTKVRHF